MHPYFDRLIKPLLTRQNDGIEDLGAEMGGLDEEIARLSGAGKKADK